MVIFYIEKYGPSTLVEISVFYNVEKPSITRTVHRLEEKQIIEQIPSKDRREKIIQLTPFGLEIYQETHGKIVQLEHRLMKDIPKEDQHLVFQILPKIQENILEKEGNGNDQC
jgi:DNA-binding MarR family transcriptional regulator